MDELEKSYNKRFKDKEIPNDDFDVDGLWESVAADLDKETKPKGGFRYFKGLWPYGIVLLFFVGIGGYFVLDLGGGEMPDSTSTLSFSEAGSTSTSTSNGTELTGELSGDEGTGGSRSTSTSTLSFSEAGSTSTSNGVELSGELSGDEGAGGSKAGSTLSFSEAGSNSTTITEMTSSPSSLAKLIGGGDDIISPQPRISNLSFREVNLTSTSNSTSTLNRVELPGALARDEAAGSSNANATSTSNDTELSGALAEEKMGEELTNTQMLSEEIPNADVNKELAQTPKTDEATPNTKDQRLNTALSTEEIKTDKEEITNNTITKTANDSIAIKPSADGVADGATNGAVIDSAETKGMTPTPPLGSPVKKKALQWTVGAYGGFQKMDASFILPANTSEIIATERGDYGSSYGVQLGLIWNKHWMLQSGLEYQKLWSRFEYTNERDSFVANQLVQVFIDSITGEELDRNETDTTYTISEMHHIIHNNAYTIFQIPLELGWQHTGKRWTYGLSAGATLNFVTAQSGRSLNRESIVTDFTESKNEELIAFKDFHLGAKISPFIGYRLNSWMTVKVMPQCTWYSGARGERIRGAVSAYGVNVGVGWRL